MKFVEIKDTKGSSIAVNPDHISYIVRDAKSGIITIVFSNERRIQTGIFRSVPEAVKFCLETSIDTSKVGRLQ